MLRTIRNLALSQTARDTYLVFGGNVITTALNTVFFIAVVRSLLPSDFGIFSSLADFIVIVSTMADLGIGASLARFLPRLKPASQQQFLKTTFRFVSSIGLAILAILLLFAAPVGRIVFTSEALAPLVRIASIGVFLSLVLGIATSALQAKREFKKGVYTEVSYVIAKALIALVLFLTGRLNLAVALLIFAVGPILGILLGGYFLNPAFLLVREAKGTLSELFRFVRFMAVHKIVANITARIGTIMLLNLAGAYETGIYSAAFRFASVYGLLSGSFGIVLAPRFASFTSREETVAYLKKVILMTGAIIATMPVLAIVAEPVVLLIAGANYADSISVLRWLVLAMVPFVATIPAVGVVVYALEKPQVLAASSVLQLLSFVLLNVLLIPKFAILGLVASTGLANLVPLAVLGGYAFYGLRRR